jgi:hypothetical protein
LVIIMHAKTVIRGMVWVFMAAGWLAACGKPPAVPEAPTDEADLEVVPIAPEEDLSNSCGLIIASTPSTEVLVDGKSVGKTPITVEDLASGSHEVTFVGPGGDNVTMTVELAEGQYQRVQHNIVPTAREM